ncbi:MAG TPA: matrixin family metalloprotease [Polyangiaceae bacterium]|nr:matrixin family metalloprotease [Polyangiaceae bacterium]
MLNRLRGSRPAIASIISSLLIFGAGCGDVAEGDAARNSDDVAVAQAPIGNAYPSPHNLELSKRQYTWTIKKQSDGWYVPRYSWIIDQPLWMVEKANAIYGALPADATLTETPDGKTKVVYPRMTNAYIDRVVDTTVATWASVVNIQFRKVTGAADITFSFTDNNASAPSAYPEAEGWCDRKTDSAGKITGADVVINLKARKPATDEGYEPFWKAGDYVSLFWHGAYENQLLRAELHEFGHFLGLAHAFYDTANYGRDSDGNSRTCGGVACPYPPSNDDLSIMDYNLGGKPVLLSTYDINIVQAKYGRPTYSPMIELSVPSMNEHFYTSSWSEANHVLHSGYASGVRFTNLTGALYYQQQSNTTPLHRFFEPAANGHTYILGGSTSRPGSIYEGVVGYSANSSATNLSQLGAYHLPSSADELFFTVNNVPAGYVDTGRRYGYVFPMKNIGRY